MNTESHKHYLNQRSARLVVLLISRFLMLHLFIAWKSDWFHFTRPAPNSKG
jgi:hypothetical protein